MKIRISSSVLPLSTAKVWNLFDINLFKALSPPFPPVSVERFDGCLQGDEVHVLLFPSTLKIRWESIISEQGEKPGETWFTDEGGKLPFPLKRWKHRHRILYIHENAAQIRDEIDYTTGFLFLDIFLYPFIFLPFLYRKPIYRRYMR